jgi:hypothetical protein
LLSRKCLRRRRSTRRIGRGEQSREHFVHGFLEAVEGVDFARKVEMGIRANRYKVMVPTVTGALRLRGRAHAQEARVARARTGRKLEIQSARVDDHCGYDCGCLLRHRAEMAMAFAELLNEEARARNRYLRMVVVGAHAVLYHRKPHHDALRSWAKKLM